MSIAFNWHMRNTLFSLSGRLFKTITIFVVWVPWASVENANIYLSNGIKEVIIFCRRSLPTLAVIMEVGLLLQAIIPFW